MDEAKEMLEKLRDYLKTTRDGQFICHSYHINPDLTDVGGYGYHNPWSYPEAIRYVELFVEGLYREITSRIASIPKDFLSINDYNRDFGTGSYFDFGIEFDESKLKRKSLFNTRKNGSIRRTGKGINNILTLFIHGYKSDGTSARKVGGYWEHPDGSINPSHIIGSKTHRDPDNFIREYINEFNRMYGGEGMAIILLDHKYETKQR